MATGTERVRRMRERRREEGRCPACGQVLGGGRGVSGAPEVVRSSHPRVGRRDEVPQPSVQPSRPVTNPVMERFLRSGGKKGG